MVIFHSYVSSPEGISTLVASKVWDSPHPRRCCQQDLQIRAAACVGSAEDWGRSLFRHERFSLSILDVLDLMFRDALHGMMTGDPVFAKTYGILWYRWPMDRLLY